MNYIQEYEINAALQKLERAVQRRIEKHGYQPHASPHESVGICFEELHEVMESIHLNETNLTTAKEFRDLAVAAFWAYLSLESGNA